MPAFHVYFLGTGAPNLSRTRHGISTLIKAGSHWLLFDTGRATLQRMFECGVPVNDVTNVFFTHLHSDHICGFGDLWMTGWFVSNRSRPMSIWGPPGTQRFATGIKEVHHFDLDVRLAYESANAAGIALDVIEFEEGIIFDRDGVVVTVFLVDHGPDVKPAYGFRIDHRGRSIVLSGDTTYCDAVVRHATGADLLIHELAGASERELSHNGHARKIVSIHTSPEQLAEICRQARPRSTLIHHVSLWDATTGDVLERIRSRYDGEVGFAEDCMEALVDEDTRIIAPAGVPRS